MQQQQSPTLNILFISLIFATVIFSSVVVCQQQMIDDDDDSIIGKPCSQSFHCWRTEPVQDDGIPLSLVNRRTMIVSKRLDISGGGGIIGRTTTKGARCRCKDSICQYFISTQQRFLPCEEF